MFEIGSRLNGNGNRGIEWGRFCDIRFELFRDRRKTAPAGMMVCRAPNGECVVWGQPEHPTDKALQGRWSRQFPRKLEHSQVNGF